MLPPRRSRHAHCDPTTAMRLAPTSFQTVPQSRLLTLAVPTPTPLPPSPCLLRSYLDGQHYHPSCLPLQTQKV